MQNAPNLAPRGTIVTFCITVIRFAPNLSARRTFVTFCMTGGPV
jgi:hypothetical protein